MSAEIASVPNTPPAQPAAAPAPQSVTIEARPAGPGRTQRVEVTPAPAAATPAQEQRPEWLPSKFKSPEEMAQAYAHLEQRLGSSPAPAAQPVAAQPEASPAPAGGQAALVDRMTQAYASSGAIPPELRAEFTKTYPGLPESFIDNQLAYIKAQGQRASEMAVKRLGGEQAVQELMDWAKSRLSQQERDAFNRLVYSSDEHSAQLAVDGLAAKYEMEVGRSPKIIAGRKPQEQYRGIVPFQSAQEWGQARKDIRYKTDPAYRQQVEDRLRVSLDLGLV